MVRWLLPHYMRKEQVLHWLTSLLWPLVSINQSFVDFVIFINYRSSITAQVIGLEQILNDLFDKTDRGILIKDGTFVPSTYIYSETLSIDEPYVYGHAEVDPSEDYIVEHAAVATSYDYIVCIPVSLVFDFTSLVAILNKYRLAGKRWNISFYS